MITSFIGRQNPNSINVDSGEIFFIPNTNANSFHQSAYILKNKYYQETGNQSEGYIKKNVYMPVATTSKHYTSLIDSEFGYVTGMISVATPKNGSWYKLSVISSIDLKNKKMILFLKNIIIMEIIL